MSADALHARAAALLAKAVVLDSDGDVRGANRPLALQAVELVRSIGGEWWTVPKLLSTQNWWYYPGVLLSLVIGEEELQREARIHGIWSAWQVRHLWRPEDRSVLTATLIAALRFARGRISATEVLRLAEVAAELGRAAPEGFEDPESPEALAARHAAQAAAYAASANAGLHGARASMSSGVDAGSMAAAEAAYAASYEDLANPCPPTVEPGRPRQQRRLISRVCELGGWA